MKGFNTSTGYMGWIPEMECYLLFASEIDYKEFMEG